VGTEGRQICYAVLIIIPVVEEMEWVSELNIFLKKRQNLTPG
jgi:hypothetical protein